MLEDKISLAQDSIKESQLEVSQILNKKPEEYEHLSQREREQVIKNDITIQGLKDKIKEVQSKQLKKFEKGPLSQIRNKDKANQFVQSCIQLQ